MDKISKEDKIVYVKTAIFVTVVLILFSLWFWWTKIFTSKSNVFYGMLNNSLSTLGVAKTISQEGQSGKTTQISQAQFGGRNLVNVTSDINQKSTQGDISVTTQTVSLQNEDFVRYKKIDISSKDSKKVDFSPILNKWARTSQLEGGGGAFSEALFGIVLTGNLPKNNRDQLMKLIHEKEVYKIDFTKTKVEKTHGRTIYTYDVEVNIGAYAELLKKYDELLGLKQMAQLQPEQYKNEAPIKVKLSVDVLGRQLVAIKYEQDGREEAFAGYGIRGDVKIPEDFVSRQELESKLQTLMANSNQ